MYKQMENTELIEFIKVAYHLYLDEVLSEREMVHYLQDGGCDVVFYDDNFLSISYLDDGMFPTKVTVDNNLNVQIENDLDDIQ